MLKVGFRGFDNILDLTESFRYIHENIIVLGGFYILISRYND